MDEQKQTNQKQDEPVKDDIQKKLEECEKQRDEYLAGWQRAKADFLNYKKDEMQRFEEIAKFANEDIMHELVTVMNSFDLGIAALEKQGSVEKGVYMIRAQLGDILKRRGLEEIRVKPGDAFDPSRHDAVATVDSERPEGSIAEEVEAGYSLHGKIIRPVRVKVSKGNAK